MIQTIKLKIKKKPNQANEHPIALHESLQTIAGNSFGARMLKCVNQCQELFFFVDVKTELIFRLSSLRISLLVIKK